MNLTAEQVMALAPDAASAAAGRKLARVQDWKDLGQSEGALWGKCQGSALYQVQVDLADLVGKCSCPSRKFPCKHVLGLMLLAAGQQAVPVATVPDWVQEWLDKRGQAAVKKAQKAAEPPKEVDLAAQEKRQEQRRERVLEGLASLELWLRDLARTGLAPLGSQGVKIWKDQAARLVDAQAPALAGRLRRLAGIPGSRPDWPGFLLRELGVIALLIDAYRRLEEWPPPLQADLRHLIGFTTPLDEVRASGERLRDDFWVLGSQLEDEERLRVQRTWLLGQNTGRSALLLQFSVAGQPFSGAGEVAGGLPAGSVLSAELAFWPSAWPQRALVVERGAQPEPLPTVTRFPHLADFEALLDQMATARAALPFLERQGVFLADVVPTWRGGELWVVDRDGATLPAQANEPWRLMALAAGRPLSLAAEWDGQQLGVLAAAAADGYYSFGGLRP